jgi:hypothetical protein
VGQGWGLGVGGGASLGRATICMGCVVRVCIDCALHSLCEESTGASLSGGLYAVRDV